MSTVPAAITLPYHPVFPSNPYQSMLYARCAAAGIAPLPIRHFSGLETESARGPDAVLHLHWTHLVLRGAATRGDAEERVDRFSESLDRFAADGGRIVWTVHNVLPHEVTFPDLEAAVCRVIAQRAALVHVMCAETPAAAAPWYEIEQSRVAVIPHASYLGVYPDHITRAEARARLGLEPHHTVLTAFGGIRRYKALLRLLDAFEAVASRQPDLRLVIAGKPMRFGELESLRARCAAHPAVIARLERIPDAEVQIYIKAADAVILPHTRALNSGLVGLAYAFGRPVVAPDVGCIASQVTPDTGLLFRHDDPESLVKAMAAAASLKGPHFEAAALERARAYPPAAMAEAFVTLIRRVRTQLGAQGAQTMSTVVGANDREPVLRSRLG